MQRVDFNDIIFELTELSREIIHEIKMQLSYYRVSVYKHETADLIQEKINTLKTIAEIMVYDDLLEPIYDYESTVMNGNQNYIPEECFFSTRVSRLISGFEAALALLDKKQKQIGLEPTVQGIITNNISRNKQRILSFCRNGTDHWRFFQQI